MKRLLREPLFHFLVLGAALFAAHALLNRNEPSANREILVSAGRIETLAANFAKVWQRPPSAKELKGAIDQYVKEEMFSREAIALGLDQQDTVIRRRLQQKMEFLAEDFAAASDPTEAELLEYYAGHPDQFAEETKFSFRQIYLNPEKRGDHLERDANRLLASLRLEGEEAGSTAPGDSFLLPHQFTDESEREVAARFGSQFTASLAEVKPGEWAGPIRSGYGVHLVFLSGRTEGRVPPFEQVREQVKRELLSERRREAKRRFLEELLQKYHVRIEWPQSAPDSASLTRPPDE